MSNSNSNTNTTTNAFLAAMQSKNPSLQTCVYKELNSKANKLDTARVKLINKYTAAVELFSTGTINKQYGVIVKDKANVGKYIVKLKYGIYSLRINNIDSFNNIDKANVAKTVADIIELTEQGLLDDALAVTFAARNASNDEVDLTDAA